MITDEKLGELVARANMAVAAGMGRTTPWPEHQAIASPVVAVVLEELIRAERDVVRFKIEPAEWVGVAADSE